MSTTEVIAIIVRVMPSGDELEVELPIYSTGKEIKEELLSAEVAPRVDPEGNPYVYDLIFKRKNEATIKPGAGLFIGCVLWPKNSL